ncbi:hypothetical protein [Lysinibacillus sp. NPDC092081]|uniref:hypothetical protein n=1 Tax=Lysinibacillus sp. NPDC092081 TaxID=3364131 RepID=UPI0037F56A44
MNLNRKAKPYIGNQKEEGSNDRFKEIPHYSATIKLGIDFKFFALFTLYYYILTPELEEVDAKESS